MGFEFTTLVVIALITQVVVNSTTIQSWPLLSFDDINVYFLVKVDITCIRFKNENVEDMLHTEYKKTDFLLQTSMFVLFYFE